MFIQTEKTPNPETLKFLPGQQVLAAGSADFADQAAAEASPLAEAIFAVEQVSRVFLGSDFISVTKTGGDWPEVKAQVLGAIMQHYTSGAPVLAPGASLPVSDDGGADPETVRQIKTILDEKIRPAVARDGGDVVFDSFREGVVYLHMQGACAGCPSSTMTLKSGIENLLRYYVPEVLEVRQT